MGAEKATVLLVMGAHRSGTSSLSGTLACLGAALPRNLMPPTSSNEKGYFEPLDIANLHDEMLARAGSAWHDIAPFPDKWYASPDFGTYSGLLAHAYRDNYGDAALVVLKEPRINRLIPLWETVFETVGAVPKVILITRHPLEVARSLETRDGFPLPLGLLIWLRNQLDAERTTRHLPRVFVNYDELIAGWRSTLSRIEHSLGITFPGQGAMAQAKVDAFLDASLRHHRAPPADEPSDVVITQWAQEAFRILSGEEAMTEEGRAALDRIREALDRATTAFAPLVALYQCQLADARQKLDARSAEEHLRQAHQTQVSELTRLLAERDGQLAERDAQVQRLAEAASAADAMHHAMARDFQNERAMLTTAIADLHTEIARMRETGAAIEKVRHEQIRTLGQQLAERDLHLSTARGQTDRLTVEIEALTAELAAVHGSLSWRMTAGLRWLAADRAPSETRPDQTTEPAPPTREAPAVDPRALLDVTYYMERYDDVRASALDPWEHYVTTGFKEGRNPNALFDTDWYLRHNPDAAQEGMNPLLHYLTRGAAQGANPGPDFDGAWYVATNPDVAASGMNPLLHYLDHGRAEGRETKPPSPSPTTLHPADGAQATAA
ncbi:hypothetical protein J5J86_16755 [Aquabacter sp. L1I39]|uniref:sulfotransferase family protein n=1 Tax=Aquabacter sp. L1I39 TaxID=2820278 RepID=UPI001ADB7813|nr:hypothetical protein [Aquabacter sp. L1I39]QTL02434.1 hypothetical protein J5J86_16755 [Aquabacter sp. L1I39]